MTYQSLDEVALGLGFEAGHVLGAELGVGGPVALSDGGEKGLG